MKATARWAWTALGWNLLVIIWGAFVRASGSGAGCGEHWPLCNGEVLPRSAKLETIIEFSHRFTSGIALLLVVALVVSAFRNAPVGHPVRWGARWCGFFIVTEALVGAALVLLGLVGVDPSRLRALFMAIHLVNTFLLVAWLTLTAAWASGWKAGRGVLGLTSALRAPGGMWTVAALFAMLVASTAGALTALGDTLFPVETLREGIAQDFSANSHFLIRLRIFHPVLACFTALAIWLGTRPGAENAVGAAIPASRKSGASVFPLSRRTHLLAQWVSGLALGQIAFGFLNLVLLAPTWMQLVHLAWADALWILLLLYASSWETPSASNEVA